MKIKLIHFTEIKTLYFDKPFYMDLIHKDFSYFIILFLHQNINENKKLIIKKFVY
jgi:hypothetical protein